MGKTLRGTITIMVSTFLLSFFGTILGQNKVLNLQNESHYFQVQENAANDLELGAEFTIEAWIYIRPRKREKEEFIFRAGEYNNYAWQIYIEKGTGDGDSAAVHFTNAGFTGNIVLTVPTEEWHHIAVVSKDDWTNNYLDGKAKQDAYDITIGTTPYIKIGAAGNSYDFHGAIDEVRISNVARYGRWGFDPLPTKDDVPFVSDDNTVFLFHFDDDALPPTNSSGKTFTIDNYGIVASDYVLNDDASFTSALPLPVELVSFTVTAKKGSGLMLEWATATEVNNYGFEIQRAISGEFENIGFLKGAGNSNSTKQYNFVDIDNLNGKIRYRLKQIDIDGEFEYSKVISINTIGLTETTLSQNYPNPFNPTTQISFQLANTEQVNISVYSILGEKVAELVNEVKNAGTHKVDFNASGFTSGFYIYKIETPNYIKTMKMMLLK